MLKRVLYGISCRNYEAAAEAIPDAIGLSSSTVSRGFVQASAAKLREMQQRDLSGEHVLALFLNWKSFADVNDGHRDWASHFPSKNAFWASWRRTRRFEKVLTPFLAFTARAATRQLPGSTGDHRWRQESESGRKEGGFRKRVLIQRCQWHKRENVVSYLSKGEQASLRKRLQSAYNRPQYKEALAGARSTAR